jgi:beta-lactamase class D OXA-2
MVQRFFVLIMIFCAASASAQTAFTTRPDWQSFFADADARGTLLIADFRDAEPAWLVFNPERAQQRFSPASTFKISHTLMALDAGVVRDAAQVFVWDGVARRYEPHNHDQTLRTAMRHSTVWVYQGFAKAMGEAKAATYLAQIGYGNARTSAGEGRDGYWLDGDLAISAFEQIEFLRRLYRDELPFSVAHQQLVKELIEVERGDGWVLRAKTGWSGRYGWWVGWVERVERVDGPNAPVFFALNIDTPNRMADLGKRESITRAVLRTIGALPSGLTPYRQH